MNDTNRTDYMASGEVLRGRNVHLRPPRVDELPFIRALWGDPETMSAVGGTIDFPEPMAREWFARMVDPGGPANCYCLIYDRNDEPVGEISFHRWDAEKRSAGLNIKVLASRRGQGYAKDALDAFLRFFFGRVGGQVMVDDVALDNRVGQQLLESIGFERDRSVAEVCWLTMTRTAYVRRFGEPDRPERHDD